MKLDLVITCTGRELEHAENENHRLYITPQANGIAGLYWGTEPENAGDVHIANPHHFFDGFQGFNWPTEQITNGDSEDNEYLLIVPIKPIANADSGSTTDKG